MENFKVSTFFAGVNGAGKSTLYHTLGENNFGVRLNSDEILVQGNKNWKDLEAQAESGRKMLEKQKECFDKNLSFNRETTLSGAGIINTFKEAKKLGYKVNLFYIGVNSVEIAKERVSKRVSKGGHGVSDNLIEKRYSNQKSNLLQIIPLCDDVKIYDNSDGAIKLVAFSEDKKLTKVNDNCQWVNKLIDEINLSNEQQKE